MSLNALSAAQFGDTPAQNQEPPQALRMPINEPGDVPLSYSSKTNSSAKAAAVWRKPPNISMSSATNSSVFDPYSN